jgi:hypothetical protein
VILAMQPFAHFSLGKAGTPSVRPLFGAFLTFLLCGCANVEYTAYSGQQQNWPVAKGSFVQRKFELPVYFGGPALPSGAMSMRKSMLRSVFAMYKAGGRWKSLKPIPFARIRAGTLDDTLPYGY